MKKKLLFILGLFLFLFVPISTNAEEVNYLKFNYDNRTFQTEIEDNKSNITRIYFDKYSKDYIESKQDISVSYFDCADEGYVKCWYEHDPDNTGLYYLHIASDDDIYIKDKFIFENFKSTEYIYFYNINTSLLTTAYLMFSGCTSLKELDLSAWDVSNVKDFRYMFKNCSSLKKINLSSFNTSSGEEFSSMFSGCTSLDELDLRYFNFENSDYFDSLIEGFNGTLNISGLNLSIQNNTFTLQTNTFFPKIYLIDTVFKNNISEVRGFRNELLKKYNDYSIVPYEMTNDDLLKLGFTRLDDLSSEYEKENSMGIYEASIDSGLKYAQSIVMRISKEKYPTNFLKLGDTFDLSNLVNEEIVSCTSSDNSIITINDNIITTHRSGKVVVYVTTKTSQYRFLFEVTNPLKSVKINEVTDKIKVGDTYNLTYTYEPSNTTENLNSVWTSSDNGIATINNYGQIKALTRGEVTFTLTVNDHVTDTITLFIYDPKILSIDVVKDYYEFKTIDSVATLDPIKIIVQDDYEYTIDFDFFRLQGGSAVFSINGVWDNDPTINLSHNLTPGIYKGIIKIGEYEKEITIKINRNIDNISLKLDKYHEDKDIIDGNIERGGRLLIGETDILNITYNPGYENDGILDSDKVISWKLSKEGIVSISKVTDINNNKQATIKALNPGFVTITATLSNGITYSYNIYVVSSILNDFTINCIDTIEIDDDYSIMDCSIYLPRDKYNYNLNRNYTSKFYSSDTDILKIDENTGKILNIYKKGTVTIKVVAGGITKTKTLTIKPSSKPITNMIELKEIKSNNERYLRINFYKNIDYYILKKSDGSEIRIDNNYKDSYIDYKIDNNSDLISIYEYTLIAHNASSTRESNTITIHFENEKNVDNNNIIAKLNTLVSSLIDKIKTSVNYVIKHLNKNHYSSNDNKVKTGDIIRISNNDKSFEYRIVVKSDVNGDGEITPLDYVAIKNHIMGKSIIKEDYFKEAADANDDGEITPLDYVAIKNYIMKKED